MARAKDLCKGLRKMKKEKKKNEILAKNANDTQTTTH
jgi:hypothetical protein